MERSAKLQKGSTGYGLTLIKPEGGKGAIVAGTLVASPAAASGALFGGDKLVSVDGRSANEMEYEEVTTGLLASACSLLIGCSWCRFLIICKRTPA
jgi:C-terminal processing protease CtpA/Prc